MEEFERLLPWRRMPPGGGGSVLELAYLGPHNLHGATVSHDFLSPDPPHWGPTKRATLFWVWYAQELGPNGCRNLDRDTQREVKTHFILT
jgi:hypothetical protein